MAKQQMLAFETKGPITLGTIESASVLDAVNVSDFGQSVLGFVEKTHGVNLLLDFSQVHYLSSAVLTELLRIKEAAEKGGGSMRLCGLNTDIRKVFTITNLDKIFVLYGDSDDGLQKYARSLEREAESDAWEDI
jgi:anti-sigma B factor antagonist